MKLGKKTKLIFLVAVTLPLVIPTPTSSVLLTKEMKLKALQPKDYATVKSAEYGWNKNQRVCLGKLWGKESAWNHQAKSPTHDYGIPQRHMVSNTKTEIQDFLKSPHTQIDWGLRYISTRYGSPCAAWRFHLKNNWY